MIAPIAPYQPTLDLCVSIGTTKGIFLTKYNNTLRYIVLATAQSTLSVSEIAGVVHDLNAFFDQQIYVNIAIAIA